MTTSTMWSGLVVLALATTAHAEEGAKTARQAQAQAAKTPKPKPDAKNGAIMISATEVKWGDAPPDLPKGAQLGVLYGDPSKPAPYTVRVKMPDGYKIPPHWHTNDEQLTIISGKLVLHMGDTMGTDAHELYTGAYHFLPGKMHHAAEARGTTVVQINGVGPFDITYLDPSDKPIPKTAKK